MLHAKQCRQEYLEGVRKDDAVQLPTVLKILQLMQPNLEALACRFVNMFADQCGTKSFCFSKPRIQTSHMLSGLFSLLRECLNAL